MKQVEIQLIRNATLKIKFAGKSLLVDPMLGPKNSFMSFVVPNENRNPTVDLPMALEKVIADIDAILLTHAHPDHIDPIALTALPKEIPFFVQPADVETVRSAGFQNVVEVRDAINLAGISISRTTGKHGPDEMLEMLGPVSGFVLQAAEHPTTYLIGDCIWNDTIDQQLEQFQPDIVITNSGGALWAGKHRILMDIPETIAVARKVPNARIIATHLSAIDHCPVTREELREEARQAGFEIEAPLDGEILLV